MSVKIRCQKTGANNDPCFRIVATDIRSPRDGKALEPLGWYDPKKKDRNFFLNLERLDFWIRRGATPSPLVNTLVKKAKAGQMAAPAAGPAAPTP